ncbi:putative disease resistance protein RGA3 [Triticum dicoccoides]|uniref:putative disease resistance protein RGA3 n=1 Tax=Triticum dicoccoides TaxID=85692 RepID=UPI001890776B|nr:putative disease resistance protein RGA3 [Triticum dicoccoides]
MAADLEWKAAEIVAVLGWLLSPVITLLLPKVLACLGFDASQKLRELEIHIIPELKKTMRALDQERMMQRGNRVKTDLDALDKMAAMLRHALEDAEDISDDSQEKIAVRCRHRLRRAFAACIALCKSSCVSIARLVRTKSARLLQWARDISLSLFLLPRSEEPVPANNSAAITNKPIPVIIDIPVTTNAEASGNVRWLSCLCTSFDLFKNCGTSLYSWLAHVFEAACFYRDWSYQVVGINKCQENASLFDMLDVFFTAMSRLKLKKRIQQVENTVSEVKKSPLLGVAGNSTPKDIANKNRRELGAASKREVFGREALRDDIMARLRETPQGDAPSYSPCYSVIGIYGVAGSGKTTFAGYIRDYIKEECKEEKLFDTIMCIHVSETFSVEDIFQEMLKDISEDSLSGISDHRGLNKKLKEALRGKRFLLILDDLWVKNKNDQQLEELISPLNVGLKGSKILVTARTKEAAGALCADKLIEMPDLDEDQYMKMFMHYALSCKSIALKEFEQVGREIAKKLHRSPIAAVTVAGRLGANPNISFWKNVAKLDMLNDTMDALWWSYKQLNPDIRRCFEFCNIFPRRFKLEKDQLVRLWIAQGFVKTSCATEEMEDVAEGYIQELVSCSFLQPKGTRSLMEGSNTDCFTIHDLLHDLVNKVAGSDYFRIENERGHRGEGWKGDVPRDVRHLFVQNYDGELITNKILGLENLRTLIINVVACDTPVEEKVLESICMRLLKLRVLAISFNMIHYLFGNPNKFLVPESIIQLKHLRYLAVLKSRHCKVILPCTLAKLVHIQMLDFGEGEISEFTFSDLTNLRHIFCAYVNFPNIGRLSSLQTIPSFSVRNEEGYEIKQLRDLNKIRGKLWINAVGHVKSKEEALEGNLAAKERLMELALSFLTINKRGNAEVAAEVLEGLCPPVGLQALSIWWYSGSRYPDWMVGKLKSSPKDLQKLMFWICGQLGPGPQLEAFPHLRVLEIWRCSWDALPGNMEHLTSLETLEIRECKNIRSLPTLPRSLLKFDLILCDDELMKGCQTEGDPNWLKIIHIPKKYFDPCFSLLTLLNVCSALKPHRKALPLALKRFRPEQDGEWSVKPAGSCVLYICMSVNWMFEFSLSALKYYVWLSLSGFNQQQLLCFSSCSACYGY